MSKKIYIAIPLLFLVSTSQATIHASTVENCITWLKKLEAPPAPPQPAQPSASKEYQKYMRARATNPDLKPPTVTFDREPPESELRESFYLWWYPGNKFGPLMIPKNKEFADYILRGGEVPPELIPSAEERAAEARVLAEQAPWVENRRDLAQTVYPRRGLAAPRFDEIHDERLDTSPTKDGATSGIVAHSSMGGPDASDPASGNFADSGPPPSSDSP